MRTYYEIRFARFFNYPVVNTNKKDSRSPRKRKRTMVFYSDDEEDDNPNVNRLRVISQSDKRLKRGVWLSSSSTASLHLNFQSSNQPHLVLVISINHKIYEEHYVSKLQFSWPQMACVSECPPRGSRVVFASYKDRVGQIQKFAIRFTSSAESQTFISSLKESLGEERNAGIPSTCPTSGNVCQREFIRRNQVHHIGEEIVNRYPAAKYRSLVESSLNDGVLYPCSERTIHHRENELMSVTPDFTEIAADKHIRTQQEPAVAHGVVSLDTGISKGMTASSFNDMLMKLETIIKGLGGDLSL